MPVDVWSEELDLKIQHAVRGAVPARLYDDAVQEARLAVFEAEEGQTPSWYVSRGVWAAQKYVRGERAGPVFESRDMDGFDNEGNYYPDGDDDGCD